MPRLNGVNRCFAHVYVNARSPELLISLPAIPWENTKLCASTKGGAGGSRGGLIPSAECQHMAVLT